MLPACRGGTHVIYTGSMSLSSENLVTGLDGVWKQMGEARRMKAALALYNDPEQRENRMGMDGIIAQLRHFRPQFVKKLPVEKRAQYAATLPLPLEAVAQMIIAYHFHHQRPMMSDFLD